MIGGIGGLKGLDPRRRKGGIGHNGGPDWDPTGKLYAFDEKYFSSGFDSMGCIVVSPDGTKLFALVTPSGQYLLRRYNLPTPYDVTGMVYAEQFSVGTTVDPLRGLDVSPDGTKFIMCTGTGIVVTVTCPTPWSLTGASAGSWTTGLGSAANRQWMSSDGLILYQQASGTIYKRSLATAWTPVSAGTTTTTLAESTFLASLLPPASYSSGPYFGGGSFSADGRRFFGYGMPGGLGYPYFWAIDLEVPNDLFSGRTYRGGRMLTGKSIGVNYPPANYFVGENGKSLFYSINYDNARGYVVRWRFAA